MPTYLAPIFGWPERAYLRPPLTISFQPTDLTFPAAPPCLRVAPVGTSTWPDEFRGNLPDDGVGARNKGEWPS
jgi:hypothetical protein